MTLQELNQLASLGEGPSLEFKRKVPRPERIAKEVIAFANTRGGRLLLGVDDDGTITYFFDDLLPPPGGLPAAPEPGGRAPKPGED